MKPRSRHPASVLQPETEPREVISYSGKNTGIQVLDACDRVRVVLSGEIPRGVKGGLKVEGFKHISDNTWEAPHTPMSIYGAQAVVRIFYEDDRQ